MDPRAFYICAEVNELGDLRSVESCGRPEDYFAEGQTLSREARQRAFVACLDPTLCTDENMYGILTPYDTVVVEVRLGADVYQDYEDPDLYCSRTMTIVRRV